jgi:hypothetical protein
MTDPELPSFFHREDCLDGYGSFQRRLCQPAHIAFFGLVHNVRICHFKSETFCFCASCRFLPAANAKPEIAAPTPNFK